MNGFKPKLAACLVLLNLCGAGGAGCAAGQTDASRRGGAANDSAARQGSARATVPGQASGRGREDEMQVLAEGSYGEGGPFVAVARDPEVYAALRGASPSLPELGADFFRSHAVAAVFVGQRNTGGYAVEIRHEGGGRLLVSERVPPADAITTQAITHPFKVVAVPVKEGEAVSLLLQDGLAAGLLRPYRVVSGELTSGGPRGVERLRLGGTLGLARQGALLTLLLDLKGEGKTAGLTAAATGLVAADGRFSVAGIGPWALAGSAAAPLRLTGRLTGEGDRLQLAFGPAAGANAGARVTGKLEVLATGPAPARARPDSSIY
jgi:hypothetical protein